MVDTMEGVREESNERGKRIGAWWGKIVGKEWWRKWDIDGKEKGGKN